MLRSSMAAWWSQGLLTIERSLGGSKNTVSLRLWKEGANVQANHPILKHRIHKISEVALGFGGCAVFGCFWDSQTHITRLPSYKFPIIRTSIFRPAWFWSELFHTKVNVDGATFQRFRSRERVENQYTNHIIHRNYTIHFPGGRNCSFMQLLVQPHTCGTIFLNFDKFVLQYENLCICLQLDGIIFQCGCQDG